MVVNILIALCLFIFIIFVGVLSLWQKVRTVRLLALLMIVTVLWGAFIALFLYSEDIRLAKIAVYGYYISAAFIPFLEVLFANVYSRRKIPKMLCIVIMALILMWGITLVLRPEILINLIDVNLKTVSLNMAGYLPYVCYYVVCSIITIIIFVKNILDRRHNRFEVRKWLLIVLCSMVLGGVIAQVFNLWLPLFGDYSLIAIGPFGLVLFIPVALFMSITSEYFSAGKILSKGFIYCLIGVLAMAGCWAALTMIAGIVGPGYELNWNHYIVGAVVLVISLIWIFILQKIGRVIVRKIDSDGYDEKEVLGIMSKIAMENHGVKDFFSAIRHTLDKAFDVERVDIVIFDQDTAKYIDEDELEVVLMRIIALKKNKTVYVDEIRNKSDYTAMTVHNIETITPIFGTIHANRSDRAIGVILMSPRKRRFSRYYGETMEKVSAILSPFIQAAVFYEQISGFNTKLKHDIYVKTQKLRETNKELRQIDSLKDDLLTIASHQLRTPLTGVLGYADMLLDGDFGGTLNKEQEKAMVNIVKSSRNMNQMLMDYLDAARIDSGRFVLAKSKVNLTEILDDEIEQLRKMAKEYGRKIVYARDEKEIVITGDLTRLKQVILNMIDNAIYYGKSKIEVELRKIGSRVVFMVKDDGIGVPQAEQGKLFTKMFRASNAKTVRPDGSGVGLYVIKNIIEDSGGELIFKSTEGKGSVFGFSLPSGASVSNASSVSVAKK